MNPEASREDIERELKGRIADLEAALQAEKLETLEARNALDAANDGLPMDMDLWSELVKERDALKALAKKLWKCRDQLFLHTLRAIHKEHPWLSE